MADAYAVATQGITLDTLQRALQALKTAQQVVEDYGADQFSATFMQADGTLAGRVVMVRNELLVQFDLLGSPSSRVGQT